MSAIVEHRKKVLREARANVKLSQRKFAEKIGRKPSFVVRHELGQEYITIDDVCDWARGADMDAVVLFAQLTQSPDQLELTVGDHHFPSSTENRQMTDRQSIRVAP